MVVLASAGTAGAEGHPLGELLLQASAGRFVAPDGSWTRVAPWRQGLEAVIAVTGHAVFAVDADITDETLVGLGADGFGGAHHPRLVVALAGARGWIDSLDVVMVARAPWDGQNAPRLVGRPDLAEHPRAQLAASLRSDAEVFGLPDPNDTSVAVVATGIGGLPEISFQLDPAARGRRRGASLAAGALARCPPGSLAVAAVAPGNVASLRTLLAVGFRPVGSIQLFRRNPA